MEKRKGQVSTEYLIIIGVVLVIALVVVFLLTRTTGTAGGTIETQSKSYWASAAPFSMDAYKASGSTLDLQLKNNDVEQLTLTAIDGTGISSASLNTTFANGETKAVNVTLSNACGAAGTRFQLANVTLTYSKGTLAGLKEVGAIPLVGTCS
jgi:uncharacterized protein (UPF0333 family)